MTQVEASFQRGQRAYVIIGNGIAGVTAAETIRSEDSSAQITIIANDSHPVYYRPALKDYLAGRVRDEKLWARPPSFYQEYAIQCMSDRVVGINVSQHSVFLQSGRQIGYERLLLANGANPRTLSCSGMNLVGVTTLRTIADYQAVLGYLQQVRRVVVVGSGTLALESVEVLRQRGYQVSHLLRHQTLWSEVLDPTASDLVLQQERRDGVDLHPGEEIAEIVGEQGRVSGVVTTQGVHIPCDMVIIAIGIEPITDFIRQSGIACGKGVRVDGAMRTNAPDVYAAGDVVEMSHPLTGRTRIIGQWYPAVQQARAAAYSMLDIPGREHIFQQDSPGDSNTIYHNYLNATFLYGMDFASVGLTTIRGYPFQEIVAEPQPRTYRKVIFKDGVPVGMLSLGNRKDALAFKRAIDHGVNLMSVASFLFNKDFNLNAWLDSQGVPSAIMNAHRLNENTGMNI